MEAKAYDPWSTVRSLLHRDEAKALLNRYLRGTMSATSLIEQLEKLGFRVGWDPQAGELYLVDVE